MDFEPIRAAHAAQAWPAVSDERLWTYFPALRPARCSDLERRYARWERGSPDEAVIWQNWMCRERAGKALVGSLQATVFADGEATIAYAVFVAHQRKGFAAEAVSALIPYLRSDYRVTVISAHVDVRNVPSQRLLEKLGFTRIREQRSEDHGQGPNAYEYVYELH